MKIFQSRQELSLNDDSKNSAGKLFCVPARFVKIKPLCYKRYIDTLSQQFWTYKHCLSPTISTVIFQSDKRSAGGFATSARSYKWVICYSVFFFFLFVSIFSLFLFCFVSLLNLFLSPLFLFSLFLDFQKTKNTTAPVTRPTLNVLGVSCWWQT